MSSSFSSLFLPAMTATIDVEDVISKLTTVEKVSLLAGMLEPSDYSNRFAYSLKGADWWHTGISSQISQHRINRHSLAMWH